MADPAPTLHRQFADPDLARQLLPHAFDRRDGAHDEAHLLRVWRNAERIAAVEGGDLRLLQAAAILHDCVWVDKASPERKLASRLAADRAVELLEGFGWQQEDIAAVAHAIHAHSFSAGITPETLEARILQDADRLDAIGLIGVARCFYVAGLGQRALYDPQDPAAEGRPLDDAAFALDHFQTKLLGLAEGFQTATGRALAKDRDASLRRFHDAFLAELG
ncbi:HD domain-containing protein [Paracoccus zhejiangensis]|uniref:HD domain-containing protein n=1 Tax=Paracoccus zhejiangensis TaxID=1077935 RepID=UPI0018E4B636|nr:HD domain-containing protein [Paracoccus zhejiangensis]